MLKSFLLYWFSLITNLLVKTTILYNININIIILFVEPLFVKIKQTKSGL